jgi:uncharacterized protein YecT (DUF1311 family)/TM2 domain-containing membrane protein YozV
MKVVKEKSLPLAIGLNFLLPGLGYMYMGKLFVGIFTCLLIGTIYFTTPLFLVIVMWFVLNLIMLIDMLILSGKNKKALVTQNTKKCPNCAELVQREAKVCRYCNVKFDAVADADNTTIGAPVSRPATMSQPSVAALSPAPAPTGSNQKVVIGVIATVVLVVVAVAIGKNMPKTTDAAAAPSAAASAPSPAPAVVPPVAPPPPPAQALSEPQKDTVASAPLPSPAKDPTEQTGICKGLNLDVTSDQVECLGRKYAEADKVLNAAYKDQMAKLDANQKTKLRDSQRAWIKEKEAKCNALATQGGTMAAVEAAGCAVEMTEQRTLFVQNFKP